MDLCVTSGVLQSVQPLNCKPIDLNSRQNKVHVEQPGFGYVTSVFVESETKLI